MTIRFLLDTNVISEPVRPQPHPEVVDRLRRFQFQVAISAVSWHELLFGCYRLPPSARRNAIEQYLFQVVAGTVPIIAYDNEAAAWHAAERYRLVSLGKTPSFPDGQIAATARVQNLILVTANVSDFYPFDGLQIENWHTTR